MDVYRIVGLNITTSHGHTYKTKDSDNRQILHDETGKGITKDHVFIKYILYVLFKNAYYAIHLSDYHCASLGGKLCRVGNMKITQSNFDEVQKNITHVPLTTIDIDGFKLNEDYEEDYEENYEDDVVARLVNEPDKYVFKFSNTGNDERRPMGYVYVNMDLFTQKKLRD